MDRHFHAFLIGNQRVGSSRIAPKESTFELTLKACQRALRSVAILINERYLCSSFSFFFCPDNALLQTLDGESSSELYNGPPSSFTTPSSLFPAFLSPQSCRGRRDGPLVAGSVVSRFRLPSSAALFLLSVWHDKHFLYVSLCYVLGRPYFAGWLQSSWRATVTRFDRKYPISNKAIATGCSHNSFSH